MENLTESLTSIQIYHLETGTTNSPVKRLLHAPFSKKLARKRKKKPLYYPSTTFPQFTLLPDELKVRVIKHASNNFVPQPQGACILTMDFDKDGNPASESLRRLDETELAWGYNPLLLVNSFFGAEVDFSLSSQYPQGPWANGNTQLPGSITNALYFTKMNTDTTMILDLHIPPSTNPSNCIVNLPASLKSHITILNLSLYNFGAFVESRCRNTRRCRNRELHEELESLWDEFPEMKLLSCTRGDGRAVQRKDKDDDEETKKIRRVGMGRWCRFLQWTNIPE